MIISTNNITIQDKNPLTKRSDNSSTFGCRTSGNKIRFTIDGKETFRLIHSAFLKASKSIYILNYNINPKLQLIREFVHSRDFDNYDEASKNKLFKGKKDDGVSNSENTVNQTLYSNFADSNQGSTTHLDPENKLFIKDKNTADEHPEEKYYTLQQLLLQKAKEGIDIKIIVWQPPLAARILPYSEKRGIDGRAGEIERLNEMAKNCGVGDKLIAKIDNTAPAITSGHHEKIIVIDERIGFCGGFDLSAGKWDDSLHRYENPLREPQSQPWHDVHCMVKGPIVRDMLYHFNQRWSYANYEDKEKARYIKMASFYKKNFDAIDDVEEKEFKVNYYDDDDDEEQRPNSPWNYGNSSIIALRTWKGFDRNGGILAWYSNMFRRAKNSIYIENQFPFQDDFVTNLLVKRLQKEKKLKVIIVGPLDPNVPGWMRSVISKMSINDINRNLERLRETGDKGKRVKTYSLISQHTAQPSKRRQIYVHSKLMIVDDKWITIGSANIDKNGFWDSSEFNLGITSNAKTGLAKKL